MSANWPKVLSVRIISTGMSCCCSWSYSVLMKSSCSFRVSRQTLTVNCFRPTLQLFGRRWRWWHGVGVDLDYVLDSKWLELRFVLLTMWHHHGQAVDRRTLSGRNETDAVRSHLNFISNPPHLSTSHATPSEDTLFCAKLGSPRCQLNRPKPAPEFKHSDSPLWIYREGLFRMIDSNLHLETAQCVLHNCPMTF